ncbi:MAG: hypothetical protein WC683_04950 [bacterium]
MDIADILAKADGPEVDTVIVKFSDGTTQKGRNLREVEAKLGKSVASQFGKEITQIRVGVRHRGPVIRRKE